MGQFLGNHQVRLDAKGRVSVPAPFRTILREAAEKAADDQGPCLVLRPSHQYACVEAWPTSLFQQLATPLERLDLFSPAYDDMATALYADATMIDPDKEGRIVLPEALVAHAQLTEGVVFMGTGRYFQIWEPAAAEQRRAEARERSRTRSLPAAQA